MATISLSSRFVPTHSGATALVMTWAQPSKGWTLEGATSPEAVIAQAREFAALLRSYGWIIRVDGEAARDCTTISVVAEMPPAEVDAKAACETRKLTGEKLRLADGAVVVVERSNGYVMSGWCPQRKWWAIDLRNEKATVVA